MTYTILPNSGQSLGVTRAPINTNFSLIQSVFATNHIGFNNTGAGKHTLIQFPIPQTTPVTAANEIAIYPKIVSSVPQLFFRPQSAGTEVQLTNAITPAGFTPTFNPVNVGGQPVTGGALVTFLPGNMILIGGVVTGTNGASGIQQIIFPFNVGTIASVTITRFTLGGGGRSTHIVTAVGITPASITVDSLDSNGNHASGFSYYYNILAGL